MAKEKIVTELKSLKDSLKSKQDSISAKQRKQHKRGYGSSDFEYLRGRAQGIGDAIREVREYIENLEGR